MEAGTLSRESIDAAHEEQGTPEGTVPGVPGVPAGETDGGQFELLVGGKQPTTDKVRLYGGAIEIEPPPGGFKKGERYVIRVEAVCHKATFTDERDDKTNDVVGCRDERGLKITGARLQK